MLGIAVLTWLAQTPLEENPICVDNDGDGWCLEVDCDDSNANYQQNCPPGGGGCGFTGEEISSIFVGQCGFDGSVCSDWVDNDCDGLIDTDDPGCYCSSRSQ